jgi:hypothetical protein
MGYLEDGIGKVCATITALVVFFGSWIYCIAEYGYLMGVGLGWLPSVIVAVIATLLWPLLWGGIGVLAYLIYNGH